MRLTRCGLLWYQTLQHQWRPPTARPALRHHARLFLLSTRRQRPSFVESFFSARSPYDEDQTGEPREETEDDILSRARAYNIRTIQQLNFESIVVDDSSHSKLSKHLSDGIRLVDRKPYSTDFYLWTILLDYQKLKYGDKGVRRIWEGLKRRSSPDLPFEGYQGDRFWSAFVSTGTRDHRFLDEVIRYELKSGCRRPRFFLEVVGALLNSKSPPSSKAFAIMLQGAHPPDRDELYDLFVLASTAKGANSLQLFCEIYAALPPARIYGKVISYLCERGRISEAWMMHRYLLSHGDLPESFEELQPLVLDLVNNHTRLESLLHELAKAGVSMSAQAKRFYAQEKSLRLGFASENLNIVSSSTLGVRPRPLRDEFAASAFLTTTFSFDAVLGGLRFLGLTSVGPSSIRAIGLTSRNSQDFMEKFGKLADNDVDTGSSRFTRVVRRVAQGGNDALLQNILHSDQHADVFEDVRLQRRLLFKYYREQDWLSVDRTMVILTVGSDSYAADEQAANFLLQAALTAGQWTHVRTIMAEMKRDKQRFNITTVARMHHTILSKRELSKPPLAQGDFDDVAFLVSLWLEVLRSGFHIPAVRWREIIKRLGMSGRLDDLEILLVQLLPFYGVEGGLPRGVTDELLRPQLQSAIVEWGFIHTRHIKPAYAAPFGQLRYPWLRGIKFLKHLEGKYGYSIDQAAVRKACLLRLRQMFNYQTESINLHNRRTRARNRLSLSQYVEALERVWGRPLFLSRRSLPLLINQKRPLSQHKRRLEVKRRFAAHVGSVHVSTQDTYSNKGKESEQDKDFAGKPEDFVVLQRGPLSQAYWSSRK